MTRAPAIQSRWWISVILFGGVVFLLFAARTWPYWIDGKLLAASHADEPFHFTAESVRLSPDHFVKDLTAEAGKNLGEPYESFYRSICLLVNQTGLSLVQVNMLVCWAGNILYLAGLMVLLRQLRLPWWLCAFGTLLAAQRFALMVQTPVTHGLAIPREFWLWPLPWFLTWFTFGVREKAWLVLFYAVLGLVYTATYPLWAVVFGLAFGLVDLWRIAQGKKWKELFWLAGGAAICIATVAIYNAGTFGQIGGGEDSALLERTKHTVGLYFTKGFRRFILFGALGAWAFWELRKKNGASSEAQIRLMRVWLVAALVCLIYQPLEGPFRVLSMLYLGRLSIFVFVISMIGLTLCLHICFRWFPVWKKSLVVVALAAYFVFPLLSLNRDRPDPQFVRLCWWMKEHTNPGALAVVPPIDRGHFFRVYAERGMWIAPYDKAVLWQSRETYSLQRERVAALRTFFDSSATPLVRKEILGQMRQDGVDYLLTRTDDTWAENISCPLVYSEGRWQVRSVAP